MIDKIQIIIGLGNPGKEYAPTYHNVGQQFLEVLSHKKKTIHERPLFNWQEISEEDSSKKTVLIWPKTFMNNSGKAVAATLSYFAAPTHSLIVAHDDFDIPLGEFRLVKNRGSAGHHGIDSIIERLGTKDFTRARIGVRTSKEKAMELVLKKISQGDKKKLQGVFAELREKVIEKT